MKKTIPGYANYELDDKGTVYCKGKPKRALVGTDGKPYVTIWKTDGKYQVKKYIAHLLAITFLDGDESSGGTVCYRDGNPSNINIDNLYWGTRSEMQKGVYQYRLLHQDTRDSRVCKLVDMEKTVYQLDPKDLSVVNSFRNLAEAAKYMDVPHTSISNACYHKDRTCCHYRWCFDYQYSDLV